MKNVSSARLFRRLLVMAAVVLPLLLALPSCNMDAKNATATPEEPPKAPEFDTSLVLYPVTHMDTSDFSQLAGYIDRQGKLVVPCTYQFTWPFVGGLGRVKDAKTEKYGFVDGHGKLVIPCKYDFLGEFSDGLASFELNGAKGFLKANGEEAFRHTYSIAEDFHDGVAVIGRGQPLSMDKTYGLIDQQGKELVRPIYTSQREFHEGVGLFQSNWKIAHFFDREGKELFAGRRFTAATTFYNGLASVCEEVNGKEVWGFMNREGKIIQEVHVEGLKVLDVLSNGRAAYRIGEFMQGEWGYVDAQGKVVVTPRFWTAETFDQGLAKVAYQMGEWALIDTTGKAVFRYAAMDKNFDSEFSDGLLAAGNREGKSGFVDRSGKWVIAPRFSRVGSFSHGLAEVSGDTSGYIDTQGRWVWVREW